MSSGGRANPSSGTPSFVIDSAVEIKNSLAVWAKMYRQILLDFVIELGRNSHSATLAGTGFRNYYSEPVAAVEDQLVTTANNGIDATCYLIALGFALGNFCR